MIFKLILRLSAARSLAQLFFEIRKHIGGCEFLLTDVQWTAGKMNRYYASSGCNRCGELWVVIWQADASCDRCAQDLLISKLNPFSSLGLLEGGSMGPASASCSRAVL